jgi:hypothetical protein
MELSKIIDKIQGITDSMQTIEESKHDEIKIADGNIFDEGFEPLMVHQNQD